MGQADFAYEMVGTEEGAALAAAIYADGADRRQAIAEDARAAGLRLGEVASVASLADSEVRPLADVMVLDCPQADAATLAALARLDVRAARAGAQLMVSTGMDALDAVFGCLDQSRAQVLVDPTRGERVIALGRALVMLPGMRVRELSHDDRLTLLRLTEQVSEIAARLDRLSAGLPREVGAFRFESPTRDYRGEAEPPGEDSARKLMRSPRPPLPDPRLVRRIIRQRRMRERYFAPGCSRTQRGTFFWISPPRAPSTPASRSPACASPAACRRRPRCAGSVRWSRPACSSASRTKPIAAALLSPSPIAPPKRWRAISRIWARRRTSWSRFRTRLSTDPRPSLSAEAR